MLKVFWKSHFDEVESLYLVIEYVAHTGIASPLITIALANFKSCDGYTLYTTVTTLRRVDFVPSVLRSTWFDELNLMKWWFCWETVLMTTLDCCGI